MPSNPAGNALRDILHHIDLATQFAAGFDPTSFHDDLRTVYAVIRCLEIISIAWKRIAGAGNIYRHNYEDFAARFVWDNGTCRPCAPSSHTSLIDLTAPPRSGQRTLHRGGLPADRLSHRGAAAALLELHQKIDRSYKS
jgi:uncharacterized protein with HEPN domain